MLLISVVADNGAIGNGITVIVTLTQPEFVHPVVCQFDQYVVVTVGEAIVIGLPVPIEVTSQPVSYHPTTVPEPPEMLNVIFPL